MNKRGIVEPMIRVHQNGPSKQLDRNPNRTKPIEANPRDLIITLDTRAQFPNKRRSNWLLGNSFWFSLDDVYVGAGR